MGSKLRFESESVELATLAGDAVSEDVIEDCTSPRRGPDADPAQHTVYGGSYSRRGRHRRRKRNAVDTRPPDRVGGGGAGPSGNTVVPRDNQRQDSYRPRPTTPVPKSERVEVILSDGSP